MPLRIGGAVSRNIFRNVLGLNFGSILRYVLGGVDLGSRIGEKMNALICCLVLLGSRVHGDVLGGIDTHIGGSISLWVSNEFWSCGSVFGGIFSHVSGAVGRSIFGSIDLKVSWEVGGPVFWPVSYTHLTLPTICSV